MTNPGPFSPRTLCASEYVLALHSPKDRVAVLVRNRVRGHTMQRILAAEAIASSPFLYWLVEQNAAGADVFMSMNPIRDDAYSRTKGDIKDIRHVYLDLDGNGEQALQARPVTELWR